MPEVGSPDRKAPDVGVSEEGILRAYRDFKAGPQKKGRVPELWDGKTAHRIVEILILLDRKDRL
jgi:hypothetical protein